MSNADYAASVRALSDRLVEAQAPIRILDAISWDDGVREAFFAAGCREQPPIGPDYYAGRPLRFDPDTLRDTLRVLERDVDAKLGRFNPAGRILKRMCREYRLVIDMLVARGRPAFADIAAELYGRASDALHPGQPSLADLAELLDEALAAIDAEAFLENAARDLPTDAAVLVLQERLDLSMQATGQRVRVTADDGILADAAAGSDYIKLRADTFFSHQDLALLEAHEGWVHVGTTLNGRAQPVCSFLGKGTPSTTVTQEGLAVLVEVTSLRSHPARLRRVTDRIRAIHMAENGATFVDVFRRLCDDGRTQDEAWTLAKRVFRGSHPESGPFTKDLSYSKGFVTVYNFVRLAVRRGRLDRIPLLFVGKIVLEEMGTIAELVEEGLIEAPRFLPPPFADLTALTAWMAYSNFLNRLDLVRVEADYSGLLD